MKPLTKTELLANIATATELPKNQVAAVLEALAAEIQKSLGSKGAGVITIPGLVKIEKKKVPGPQGPDGRAEPVQARRADGPTRQARLQQGQGAGPEALEGHGEVVPELIGQMVMPFPCCQRVQWNWRSDKTMTSPTRIRMADNTAGKTACRLYASLAASSPARISIEAPIIAKAKLFFGFFMAALYQRPQPELIPAASRLSRLGGVGLGGHQVRREA